MTSASDLNVLQFPERRLTRDVKTLETTESRYDSKMSLFNVNTWLNNKRLANYMYNEINNVSGAALERLCWSVHHFRNYLMG